MRIAIIDPDGSVTFNDFDKLDLDTLQGALNGGWIESVRLSALDTYGYVDEEGKLKGLAPNRFATALYGAPGDFIAGRLLITGDVDDEGYDKGLTRAQEARLKLLRPAKADA